MGLSEKRGTSLPEFLDLIPFGTIIMVVHNKFKPLFVGESTQGVSYTNLSEDGCP